LLKLLSQFIKGRQVSTTALKLVERGTLTEEKTICGYVCASVERIQFQHSAQLMKSLSQAGVLYESVVYADDRQDGMQSLRHLYASVTQFLHDSCWFHQQQQQQQQQPTQTDDAAE